MKNKYHFTESGLDNVFLLDGFTIKKTAHGSGVAFDNLELLLETIAQAVVSSPMTLRGQEVRFLRTRLDMSQSGLAKLLGVSRASVARWEGAPKTHIEGTADTAMRLLFAAVRDRQSLIKNAYQGIQDRDRGDDEILPLSLHKDDQRWAVAG